MARSRLVFERKTEPIRQDPIPETRRLTPDDEVLLGRLMHAAYSGTVDDEGESPQQAREEARATLGGKYGPVLWGCSFLIVRDRQAASASIVHHNPD